MPKKFNLLIALALMACTKNVDVSAESVSANDTDVRDLLLAGGYCDTRFHTLSADGEAVGIRVLHHDPEIFKQLVALGIWRDGVLTSLKGGSKAAGNFVSITPDGSAVIANQDRFGRRSQLIRSTPDRSEIIDGPNEALRPPKAILPADVASKEDRTAVLGTSPGGDRIFYSAEPEDHGLPIVDSATGEELSQERLANVVVRIGAPRRAELWFHDSQGARRIFNAPNRVFRFQGKVSRNGKHLVAVFDYFNKDRILYRFREENDWVAEELNEKFHPLVGNRSLKIESVLGVSDDGNTILTIGTTDDSLKKAAAAEAAAKKVETKSFLKPVTFPAKRNFRLDLRTGARFPFTDICAISGT